jgi:hypothetical protein
MLIAPALFSTEMLVIHMSQLGGIVSPASDATTTGTSRSDSVIPNLSGLYRISGAIADFLATVLTCGTATDWDEMKQLERFELPRFSPVLVRAAPRFKL